MNFKTVQDTKSKHGKVDCIPLWSFGQGHLVIFDFGNVVICSLYIKLGSQFKLRTFFIAVEF